MAMIGTGAVGSLVGGYISMGGEDITLVAPYWREHVQLMKQRGLKIDGCRGEHLVKVKALHIDDLSELKQKIDILFIALKAYDTERMLTLMKPYLEEDAWVVSFQNGIMEDKIASIVGRPNTIGCSIVLSAIMWEPGCVIEEGKVGGGVFTIGELNGQITPRLKELARILELCGQTKIVTNIWEQLWTKLLMNCIVNTMEGITGYTTDELYSEERTRHVLKLIAAEVAEVASALGYHMEPPLGIDAEFWRKSASSPSPEIDQAMLKHGEMYRGSYSSMLQDIMKGRRTEVDELNGYVVEKGKELGIPTPVNEVAVKLLKEVESGRLGYSPANLDTFLRMIT
ncbi:MAG: 2-dehydropantoate 2-reductase [Dehalococcoidia bacterium]|nr:2-dehydropantoate 2-reductase [Dehalococcoidia bacterium]